MHYGMCPLSAIWCNYVDFCLRIHFYLCDTMLARYYLLPSSYVSVSFTGQSYVKTIRWIELLFGMEAYYTALLGNLEIRVLPAGTLFQTID